MTRAILEKFIFRKSSDEISRKCKKARMWCVLQFGTICPIIKHKNNCGGTLILVKVAGGSATSLKLALFPR